MYSLDLKDLPDEEWKDIKGFEGRYQVSNKGRVKSLDRYFTKNTGITVFYPGKMLNIQKDRGNKSYLTNCRVALSFGHGEGTGKSYKQASKKFNVNRLVAEAFIPNPNSLEIVLHKDGNINNNCVENLKWADIKAHRDHERYDLGRDLGNRKIKMQCIETGKIYGSLAEIQDEFGLKGCGNLIALSKGYYVSSRSWKPNPEMKWRGYHWKVVK